ncbi:MMPL family transporter [Nocardia asteroides]|uniref:MMPL family transporter n=1 Tax=Nocardia asteroides TaxID=1824 RepID=UPI001E49B84B|nr:MMPL family transporter [Nocardia asteroides]UGT56473.1 MMPL family transporter [Nocardia asteroides]
MARALHRLGDLCFRNPWWVVAVWSLLATVVALVGITLGAKVSDKFDIPGTESDRAQRVLIERFGKGAPTTPGEGAARLVVRAPEGNPLPLTQLDAELSTLSGTPGIDGITPAALAVAERGDVTFVDITFADPVNPTAKTAVDTVRTRLEAQGLRPMLTGGPYYSEASFVGPAEAVGVAIAMGVLLVTFGSLLAAGLPILLALVGVGIGTGGVVAVSTLFDASSATLALSLMLGLAVGIDYTLFIVSRHRQQLADGLPVRESAARATGTAGSAVVFAGATVLIALCGLAIARIPFLTGMGLAAAGSVGVVVLLAITLLPALLGFAGARLIPRGRGLTAIEGAKRPNRWGQAVTSRPVATLLAGVAVLAVLALPVLDLRLGLPNAGHEPTDTVPRKSYDVLAQAYTPGLNGPLVAVVEGETGRIQAQTQAAVERISALPGVAMVFPPEVNAIGDTAQFVVIPTTAPSSEDTTTLVRAIRDTGPGLRAEQEATLHLTGETVIAIDVARKLSGALVPFLIVVVGLALALLTLAFRSLLVPLTAALGFLLSLAAALGATTAVYQWGWLGSVLNVHRPAPILAFLPILLIGVLFGLAMDYQVFLVSRMREAHVHGRGSALEAVRAGYASSVRVVAAAAVIMIAVFAGFLFSHNTMIGPIGFAMGIGVLFDALVVRMTLIPAVMALLGRHAWWLPGPLERLLPHVDIEGESLPEPTAPKPTVGEPVTA